MAEWFRTHNRNVFNDSELAPTYNAAPQTFQPVIRLNAETGEREIAMMKWGLVPYWSKTIKLKNIGKNESVWYWSVVGLNSALDLPVKAFQRPNRYEVPYACAARIFNSILVPTVTSLEAVNSPLTIVERSRITANPKCPSPRPLVRTLGSMPVPSSITAREKSAALYWK
jgi:hypothetical protein